MDQLKRDIVKLLVVQDKERLIVKIEGEREQLPRLLEEIKQTVADADHEITNAKSELKKLQVAKKDLEIESEIKLEEIRKYEKQQYEVKSNVDYQALQKEIVSRKVDNSRIEDRILEVMEKIEAAERHVKGREELLKKERERLAAEEKKVGEQSGILESKMNELKVERDKLLPDISQSVLRKYQRIFANKRDTAIVPLINYTCGGCHMCLPPQIANNVRKTGELVICENCSRILYWSDGLVQKKEGESIPAETVELQSNQ